MLLDPHSWMPASRSEEVLEALDREIAEHTAAETHGSAVELATAPHATVADAVVELAALRGGLARRLDDDRAGRRGGRHPPARDAGRTPRSPPARATSSSTRRCASSRAASRRSRCTCTSRCPTRTPPMRALNGVREHLPLLLALSANSPFWQGRDSGLASARTPIFQAFPRTGTPRSFASYEDYVEAVDVLIRCDAIPEPTFLWWDVRLQPRLGTIEVRIMDAQTRVRDTAALAALVQCLVRREALERAGGRASRSRPRCSRRTASSPPATAWTRRSSTRSPAAACRSPTSSPRRCARARRTPSGCAAGTSWRRSGALAERPGAPRQRAVAGRAEGLHGVLRAMNGDFVSGLPEPAVLA